MVASPGRLEAVRRRLCSVTKACPAAHEESAR